MAVEIFPVSAATTATGGQARNTNVLELAATPTSATAAANTAVTITINGIATQFIRINSLSVSYSAAPTAGTLTIVVNAVTILQLDITAAGPVAIPLPPGGLQCQVGQSAVITLTAAGAAVVGRVNMSNYQF